MFYRRNYIFTNKYFPTAIKTDLKLYKQDLNTWFNPDQYFSNVKLVNFDIIYNDKSRLRNIRQFIKMTLTDTTKNLRTECLL